MPIPPLPPGWLDRLYATPPGQTDEAIYSVISDFDEMFLAGCFDDVDAGSAVWGPARAGCSRRPRRAWAEPSPLAVVRDVDPARLPTDILISLLTASKWAHDRLPNRPAFVDRARAVIVERHPDRVAGLMRGLE